LINLQRTADFICLDNLNIWVAILTYKAAGTTFITRPPVIAGAVEGHRN
jgi:hypothetical protein